MITREGIPENGYIPVKGLNIHSLFCEEEEEEQLQLQLQLLQATYTTSMGV